MKMKKVWLQTSLAVLGMFASTSFSANAQIDGSGADTASGFYGSLGVGLNHPDSQRYHVPGLTSFGSSQRFKFEDGLVVTGAVGYKWSGGLRTEAEIGYRQADVHSANGFASGGSQRVWGAMINALYDIPVSWIVQPYVGGGIGVGTERWRRINGGVLAGATVPVFDSHDSGQFQWQAIGGLNFMLNPRTAIFAEYRYIDLSSRHFNVRPYGTYISGRDTRSDNVQVGVRYFFHS
jgi:opacity protein-like surface antigen